jgi:hypothetical protein
MMEIKISIFIRPPRYWNETCGNDTRIIPSFKIIGLTTRLGKAIKIFLFPV